MNNIFIGLSWPYANDELHIGHLGSSLPADIIARYYRLKGRKVCFVSGSDCFGTPISIKAQLENTTPDKISNLNHERFADIFKNLDFSFDNYTKTSTNHHIEFAKNFHSQLYNTYYVNKKDEKRLYCESCNRFLPDRYVIGNCPICGATSKGDACEKCGTILEPEELNNPKCGICNNTPILKDNFQYYLKLSSLESNLKNYFNLKKKYWSDNAIKLTKRYFKDGLIDRAISRDLDWGVPVPVDNLPNKVIYNWGENVLGYLSACKEFCNSNKINFDEIFHSKQSTHIYVHAKDNIQFHTIIFPALLIANPNNYHLPDKIFAYEFVNINGQKLSKSRGNCITARQLLEKYNVDFLRFYFARNISDKKDLDFTYADFSNCINGELINNWGNFVNRTLSFIKSKFDGKIKKLKISDEIKLKIKDTFKKVSGFIQNGKISSATKEILSLVSYSNKYFDETTPWIVVKNNPEVAEQLCYNYLTLIANIAILLNPIIPTGTNKVLKWLNINTFSYKFTNLNCTTISAFQPLYTRIEV